MKFLIDRYSSGKDTECMYLNSQALENQHSSMVREYNENIFDIFSVYRPDVYITSMGILSRQALECIKKFDTTLILSTDGISKINYIKIKEQILNLGIQVKTFLNKPNSTSKTTNDKKQNLIFPPAVDKELNGYVNAKDFKIKTEKLIIIESSINREIMNNIKHYHTLSQKESIIGDIDTKNIASSLSIIHNYEQIIFCSNTISQLFLECFIRHNNVMLAFSSETEKEKLSEITKKHFYLDDGIIYDNDNTNLNKECRVKNLNIINEKHTPENRFRRIISQLQ